MSSDTHLGNDHPQPCNPHVVQLYATAATNNIYATIFHGDFIPLEQYLHLHRHSPISTVYIYAYCNTEFEGAREYVYSAFHHWLSHEECTLWICRSTGQLCADLVPGHITLSWRTRSENISRARALHPSMQNHDVVALESLTLGQYIEICYWEQRQHQSAMISTQVTVRLGTVIDCSADHQLQDLVAIAFLPSVDEDYGPYWHTSPESFDAMENGWVRFSVCDVLNTEIQLWTFGCAGYWLGQANHIFRALGISKHLQDYAVLNAIWFKLAISAPAQEPPDGFLFICPAKEFQTEPWTFAWPACPAYWSLDPSGVERLSVEEAVSFGFPAITPCIQIQALSWDTTVYEGICEFRQASTEDLGLLSYHLSGHKDNAIVLGSWDPAKAKPLTEHGTVDGKQTVTSNDLSREIPDGIHGEVATLELNPFEHSAHTPASLVGQNFGFSDEKPGRSQSIFTIFSTIQLTVILLLASFALLYKV
ncbi:hypothetical protein MSAN_02055500 [Mycena sanguinolenta]|uniref:Uncharacterized protein n=1 Tax=Mycena sanguinolenta TaxID=230812 RepID=A0A8H6XJJ0_9AGAR|nr:hypothetical protein MSAN_02055500 [Mycena sanguinolenta]